MNYNTTASKPIALKIGSNVLTRSDGTLDITRMSALVDQISTLRKNGLNIIMISSGAVASGKTLITPNQKLDPVSSRQLFSAIGQVKLINQYLNLFENYDIVCGQILATKEDFSTRRHYLNQKNCMSVMLNNGVIPIVNENDTTSVNELMFTDNDELSGMIATMMNCQKLIILSNIDGIYNGSPSDSESKVIRDVNIQDNIEEYIQSSKSNAGRGGMITKYNIARKIAEEGVEVIIANGKTDNILVNLIKNPDSTICTRFKPSEKDVSNIKKWIAHSDSFAKGEVHINEGAKEALTGERAISLLAIGVTKIIGDFEADDIVLIMDENQNQIGVGRIAFDSDMAQKLIGKNNKKPIIHYNYLYIDK